jgi:hypothetical protein
MRQPRLNAIASRRDPLTGTRRYVLRRRGDRAYHERIAAVMRPKELADDAPYPDDRAVTLERSPAREDQAAEALDVGRCRGGALPEQDRLGTLGEWAGWRGHTAGWSGTPVTGRTRTSGASVSGCASAAAKSPTSGSTRGLRSSMSQPSGASRSAGVTGAVRLSHASCINGVRGSMSVRSNTSASATPAVAVARRKIPAT